MPKRSRMAIRWGGAAAFLAAAAVAITFSAARALDAQGNDRLAGLISSARTDQQWNQLSDRMGVGKTPLDDRAAAELRALAVSRPLSPYPFFLIGAAHKLSGDSQAGKLLVDLAVQRDPRFLPARYWRVADALDRKSIDEATEATLRVLDLRPEAASQTVALLAELTRDPQSWPRIRAALPGGDLWRQAYFDKLVEAGFDPSLVFNAIDVARGMSGKPPNEREQASLLRGMFSKGDYERAYTAWLGWLPQQALPKIAYLYDGNFTGAPGPEPFNWTFSGAGEGTAVLDKEHGLRFDLSPTGDIELARQVMLMPPGKYKLTTVAWLDQQMAPDSPVPIVWQLACMTGGALATITLPDSTSPTAASATFEVPPACVAQQLRLAGSAMDVPIRIGGYVRSVALEKAQ